MANPGFESKRSPQDPLAQPIRAFAEGNYVAARKIFEQLSNNEKLTDAGRETAKQLSAATRIDPFTIWVGLICLGVFTGAVILTSLIQP